MQTPALHIHRPPPVTCFLWSLYRRRRGATRAVAIVTLVLVAIGPLPATARVLGGAVDDVLTQPPLFAPEPPLPEALEGLQYGDPGEGIGLVETPKPDSIGEAQTRFPIDVPPGRLDWHPQLELAYTSRGPNGWVGLGWDLGAPAITVDTRWGVPRYDTAKESETYTFEGEQLSPTAHRADQLDREPERVFTKRVEGDYSLIIRHGASPQDYWWEVHDKVGNKYFYGRTPEQDAGVPEAILRDGDGTGRAYWWGLVEQRDISLNTVTYFYNEVKDAGVAVDGAPLGSQLYLSRVNYTGSVDLDEPEKALPRFGPYDVTFIRDRDLPGFSRRRDATIDARAGALRVTADLLRHVEVSYTEEGKRSVVRRYDLGYESGPFEKTLLRTLGQAGGDGEVFASHTFEYFNDVPVQEDGKIEGFESQRAWDVGESADGVNGELGSVEPTALGGAKTSSGDGRIYLGFNPFTPDKSVSIGAGIALNGADSKTENMLIDLNGDSLPDKVWQELAAVKYRLNLTRPGGDPSFGPEGTIQGLRDLPEESSFGVSVGPEAYVLVVGAMYAHGWTFTTGRSYFSDVNGDGLLDFVDNGDVLFNHLDENKQPRFDGDSTLTAVPISDEGYDPSLVPDDSDLEARARAQFPLTDTVRRWVAPWDGGIRITGPVSLTEAGSADGVRVAIQRNGTELWSTNIASGSTAPVMPLGDVVPVAKGDRLYFRTQSVDDGARDAVSWAPIITYQDPAGNDLDPRPDANGLDSWKHAAASEFTLGGRTGVFTKMPLDGQVKVSGTVRKSRATTDDVNVRIEHNGVPVTPAVPTIAADFVGDVLVERTFAVARPVPGTGGDDRYDRVALRLAVDSPIDVTALSWTEAPVPADGSPSGPRMYYVSATDAEGAPVPTTDPQGNPTIEIKAPYDIDLYPENDLGGPLEPWTWPGTDPLAQGERKTVTVDASVTAGTGVASEHFPIPVTLTAKTTNRLVAKAGDAVPPPPLGQVAPGIPAQPSFDIEVVEGEPYWFDITTPIAEVGPLLSADVEVEGGDVDHGVHWPRQLAGDEEMDAFPQPYRGWGYAGYNGDGERANQAMDEAAFVLQKSEFPENEDEAPTDFEEKQPDYKNPLKGHAYPYVPDPALNRWQGPKAAAPTDDENKAARANIRGETFGAAGGLSSSRLGPDSVRNPGGAAATGRAPTMKGRAQQDTFGANVGVGPLGAGASVSWGFSRAQNGFMDLNGDAYPDIIGRGQGGMGIQYTTEVGGLHGDIRHLDGDVSSGRELASVLQGQGAAPQIKGKISIKGSSGQTAARMTAGINLGFSGSVGHAESNHTGEFSDTVVWQDDDIATDFADLNGDFLPDRIRIDEHGDVQVRWNLGYGFSGEFQFPDQAEHFSESQNDNYGLAVSAGFNLGRFDFAGGASIQNDEQHTDLTWIDMNGDFLPDQVEGRYEGKMRATRTGVRVRFNTGSGLGPAMEFGTFQDAQVARSETFGVGGGADFTVGIGPLCWPVKLCYIIINAGGHGERSVTAPRTALVDVDGDFLPDSVSSDDHHTMEVNRNKIGRTNLLKTITRPLGARIDLGYARSGSTVDQPFPLWVLDEVSVFDGHSGDGYGGAGDDTAVTRWEYDDSNVFDFAEREYYGFAKIVESQFAGDGELYRSTERTFRNGNYYERGLLVAETLIDAGGKKYTATVNSYSLLDASSGEPADLGTPPSTTASVFPARTKVEQQWFNPDDTSNPVVKQLETQTTYDRRGNPVRMLDLGEAGEGDDVVAETTYTECDAHSDFPWTQVPQRLRLVNSTGTPLRLRVGDTPCDFAAIVALDEHLAPGGNGATAYTEVEYVDPGGQIGVVTGPENGRGEKEEITYGYDALTGLLTKVVDGHGLSTTMTYDNRFGRLAAVKEPTGAVTSFTYDARGRLSRVFSPLLPAGTPMIALEYNAEADDPYVVARHYDAANPDEPIMTVRFIDGVGKEIQTKRDATARVADSEAQDVMVVSGSTYFDGFGRPVRDHHPITEALGMAATFNANDDPVHELRTYDVMDRVVTLVQPGDRTTETDHGFEPGPFGRPMLSTVEVDPEGHVTRTYNDVRGYVVGIERFGSGSSPQFTRYVYDPLGQLVEIQGPASNVTRMSYDMLGRRTSSEGPDTGKVAFEYDLASNQIAKITPNLGADRQKITYDYRFTRLVGIQYPDDRSNNVSYEYGDDKAGNSAGRIRTVVDGTRTQDRSYDAVGNLVETRDVMKVRNLNPSTTPAHTFLTKWVRDTWGRILAMTYPDGEVVTNAYDSGGLVKTVSGVKRATTYQYVDRLEYDKFGFRNVLNFGNGTTQKNAYHPDTLWLSNQVVRQGDKELQDLRYTYDRVGNPVERLDEIPVPAASEKGGPSRQGFSYDDLYRLTEATGTYSDGNGKRREFTQAFTYDAGGRLVRKAQTDTEFTSSGSALPQQPTTYDLAYEYKASQPLAPSHVGSRSFTYDANGNNTGWREDANGQRRTITWDEEDRAATIADQGSTTTYRYGHDGELGIEQGPQGEVEYVNQWYTALNGEVFWKDYYAGDLRVVTKRVNVDGEPEHMRYFLTGDLQGSITLVTDAGGRLFEHLEYFPGGEIWVREHSEVYRQPHLYAGMYHEEFRKLYRTGARWYEPREGLFLSADPLLVREPLEAVEEPRLVADYTYSFDNPVRYVDPTGNKPVPAVLRGLGQRVVGLEYVGDAANSHSAADNKRTRFKAKHATAIGRANALQKKYEALNDAIGDLTSISLTNDDGEFEIKAFGISKKRYKAAKSTFKSTYKSLKHTYQNTFKRDTASKVTARLKAWNKTATKALKTAVRRS